MANTAVRAMYYRCPGCQARLVADPDLAGHWSPCPACGHVGIVPSRRNRQTAVWIVVGVVATLLVGVGAVLVFKTAPPETAEDTTPEDGTPKPITGGQASQGEPSLPQGEDPLSKARFLGEVKGHGYGCYAVAVLIPPMVKSDLQRLGEKLIATAKSQNRTFMKVWLYYSEANFLLSKRCGAPGRSYSVLWLNALSPDWDLTILGPVPTVPTAHGCFKQWVPCGVVKWSFDAESLVLTITDDLKNAKTKEQVCMPAVLYHLLYFYLPGPANISPWTCIPGLKRVTLHLTDRWGTPIVTVPILRWQYERSAMLETKTWQARDMDLSDVEFKAQEKRAARLITQAELEAVQQRVSRQKYEELLAPRWLKLSASIRPTWHRELPTKLPKSLNLSY